MVARCCVPGCNITIKDGIKIMIKMHVLPRDLQRRKIWCESINRSDLVDISEIKRRNVIRICERHFPDSDKYEIHNKTNLKFTAVPSIIPRCSRDVSRSWEEHSSNSVQTDFSSCLSSIAVRKGDTSLGVPLKRAGTPIFSSSKIPRITPATPKSKDAVLHARLNTVGVTSRRQLSPKARRLYSVASNLKKIAKRLDFEKADTKERLNKALEFAESPDFLRTKLNEQSLRFIWCQLQMQKNKPRGRRFSFQDKVFALSLLKQGPHSYKILRTTFALPARKTLTSLLNKIPFNVLINKKILEVLKDSVDKLDSLERCCVLLFDEMAIESSLSYDQKNDVIVGFEDTGRERKLKFADHALVLMLKGIKNKWKQPISHHFSQGGFKSVELKEILQTTIKALQEIGFTIVATVCDQYSANVNAIKQLIEVSGGQSTGSSLQLFTIGEQDIVPFLQFVTNPNCYSTLLIQ